VFSKAAAVIRVIKIENIKMQMTESAGNIKFNLIS